MTMNDNVVMLWHGAQVYTSHEEYDLLEREYQNAIISGQNEHNAVEYAKKRLKIAQRISESKEKTAKNNDLKNYLQQELGLEVNSYGWPLQTQGNYRHVMADVLGLDMRRNELTGRYEIDGRAWQDEDLSDIWGRMSDITKGQLENQKKIYDTFVNCARANSYHPIKDYISTLEWDGVKRLPYIFEEVFGCDKDNRLYQAYAVLFFMAAVKRLYEPGCKFENMLILQGPQGYGKTLFWRRLVKDNAMWKNDSVNIDNIRDANDSVSQTWFVIFEELATWSKSDARDMKDFLGKQEDQYRKVYAHDDRIVPRHCVFCGNTNQEHFLKDTDMFERRYWVVEINNPDNIQAKRLLEKMTDEYVDQIWAEAYTYYTKFGDKALVLNNMLYNEQRSNQRKYKRQYEAIPAILDIINCEYSDTVNDKMSNLYDEYTGRDPVLGREKVLRDEFRVCGITYALNRIFGTGKYPADIIKIFTEYTANDEYSADRWEECDLYVKRNRVKFIHRVKKDSENTKKSVSDYISELLDVSEVNTPMNNENISEDELKKWEEFKNSGEVELLKLNTVDIFT